MGNLIGQSLGRYHILEQLGEGGMAIVYKAYDTRLERHVAVKVILPQKQHAEKFIKRFEREAKALAQLSHPNIVKVIDYGEHEGLPFLVMEYLPGGTLKQKLSGKPMPWREAVQILMPIVRALSYAHQQKIIHRDVKPSNILITDSGEPMLSDFGIAKMLEADETLDLTGTGVGLGTPEYMSPEQAQGKNVDARSDVYSLGIVLYEMVTGRKPYQADTPMAVIWMLASEPLPHPRQFEPSLPNDVEVVLIKALAKDPKNRMQTMHDMSQVLDILIASKNVAMSAKGRPHLLVSAGVLVVSAIIGLLWWWIIVSDPDLTASRIVAADETQPVFPTAQASPPATFSSATVLPVTQASPSATFSSATILPPPSTSIPLAIVTEPGKVYYDQFENPAFNEKLNPSLWISKASNCTIVQREGVLEFENIEAGSDSACDLYPLTDTVLLAHQLGVFEMQALISSNYNHKSNITQEINFFTDNLPGGFFYAYCGLEATGSNAPTGFLGTGFYTGESDSYQDYSGDIKLKHGYDTWHTIRLEINPKTMEINCQIDGQLVGWVIPRNAELLKSAVFRRAITAHRGLNASATSYVDNVFFEPPPALSWEFNTDGDLEDWGGQDWHYVDTTRPIVKNGLLSFRSTGNDPQIYTGEGLSINADEVKTMWIRMRLSKGVGPAQLFFHEHMKEFVIQTGTEFKTYTINLGSHSDWQGIIKQLRLDPISDYVGAIIEIDYIRLYR